MTYQERKKAEAQYEIEKLGFAFTLLGYLYNHHVRVFNAVEREEYFAKVTKLFAKTQRLSRLCVKGCNEPLSEWEHEQIEKLDQELEALVRELFPVRETGEAIVTRKPGLPVEFQLIESLDPYNRTFYVPTLDTY